MIAQSPTAADAPYWSHLAQGRLSLPRCAHCGVWQWPAVARCGKCGHWGSNWADLAMTGSIFTWTRTWHPFDGTEALPTPFITVLVQIDGTDGKRLLGLLEEGGDEDAVRIGAAVAGRVGSTYYAAESVPVILWQLVRAPESAR